MTNLTDLMRTLNLVCGKNRQDPALPDFFLMSDDQRLPDPRGLIASLPRSHGGSAIILRHRDDDIRKQLAFDLVPICRKHHVSLLIAEDVALAHACHADGVHFSQKTMTRNSHLTQQAVRLGWIVSSSAHSLRRAHRAEKLGVRALLVSPVFPTASHPGARTLGPLGIARLANQINVPVYALGGINTKTLKHLKGCGLSGIAGIEFIAKPLNCYKKG